MGMPKNRGKYANRFTDEQLAALGRMYEAFESFGAIAIATGMTFYQVRNRIGFELRSGLRQPRKRQPMTHAQRVAKQREKWRRESEGWEKIQHLDLELGNGPKLTPDQIHAQRYRQSLEPRDLTAALMGDPLPGCSAYERRA
jgi:hypothetical protein